MKGVLDEFQQTYPDQVEIRIVDVWQNSEVGKEYGVRVVPTLIFLNPAGEEIHRQEGVMSLERLAAKWEELGYDLAEPGGQN